MDVFFNIFLWDLEWASYACGGLWACAMKYEVSLDFLKFLCALRESRPKSHNSSELLRE